VEVHLPLAGLIDFAAESARVEKEIARTEAELQGLRKRLDNAGFVARAPREVVEKDRTRADELAGKREKLARHLARVTSVEGPMEDKYPQQPKGDGSSGEQGSSSGTPGGQPKSQPPQQKSQPPQPKSQPPQPKSQPPQPKSQPPAPGGEGMGGGRESSGMPELARDVEKMAERAVERVKSIARGLMDKLPADLPGMGGESDAGGARARAPKRAPARRAKPKKAKGGTKSRGKAARSAKKSSRSAGSRKGKAGKGARAKSGAKRRPASRKGKK
jgi:valyl-tRNA synthetase